MARDGARAARDGHRARSTSSTRASRRRTASPRSPGCARRRPRSAAFPWFPGGPPSPYMTLYLLHGFAKALEFGVDVPKDVTTARVGLRRAALPERLARVHGEGRLLGVHHVPELRPVVVPRRLVERRRLHGRRAQGDARLLLPALEAARALPQGLSRADAQAHGPARGREARLGLRHGLGEDERGAGDVLGARGPLLALVQRHDRDARVRAAHAPRARPREREEGRPRPVAAPQQEAQPVEVHARDGRGHLLARPLPEEGGRARRPRGRDRDRRDAEGRVHVRSREVHRQEQPRS